MAEHRTRREADSSRLDGGLRLYIVRHARAFERDAQRWPEDDDRPLTESGARRFRRAARGLARFAPEVKVLWASPAKRAWQTAEILHTEAGWPEPEACAPLAPGARPTAVVEALRGADHLDCIALVGHEPNLHQLVSHVVVGRQERTLVDIKKGAVLQLDFTARPGRGAAHLSCSLPPRILRLLAPRHR
jgi:phosphohistidine phosphatase